VDTPLSKFVVAWRPLIAKLTLIRFGESDPTFASHPPVLD
jgi:hypothetical protein